MQFIEPLCENDWLVGKFLTIADFWVGGLYTNFCNNPNISFAKDKWKDVLNKWPNFKAYGERFSKHFEDYLK